MWVAGLDMHTKMVGRISATRVRTLPLKGALHSCEAIFQNNRNLNIDKHYIHCQIFFAQQMFLCFIINSFNDKTIIAMGAAILPNLLRFSMLRRPDVTSVVS